MSRSTSLSYSLAMNSFHLTSLLIAQEDISLFVVVELAGHFNKGL